MIAAPPTKTAVDEMVKDKLFLSRPWQQWLDLLFAAISLAVDYTGKAVTITSPPTGFALTVGDRVKVLTLTPAGVLAGGTITLPANPVDGQPLEVSSTQTVTALTVQPSAGQTATNAPTTLVAGTGFAYYYNAVSSTWYRRY